MQHHSSSIATSAITASQARFIDCSNVLGHRILLLFISHSATRKKNFFYPNDWEKLWQHFLLFKPGKEEKTLKKKKKKRYRRVIVFWWMGIGLYYLDPPLPSDRLPLLSSSSSSSSSRDVANEWGTDDGALSPESSPGPILDLKATLRWPEKWAKLPWASSFSARST